MKTGTVLKGTLSAFVYLVISTSTSAKERADFEPENSRILDEGPSSAIAGIPLTCPDRST
jgi:hypothetical protein